MHHGVELVSNLKELWNDFSNIMPSKNVKVAAVDVDKYPNAFQSFSCFRFTDYLSVSRVIDDHCFFCNSLSD